MTDETFTTEDIFHQVRNEVQETLLHHAPDAWADEGLDEIEQQVLEHTHRLIDLKPRWAAQKHIAWAVVETKRLIHERRQGIDGDKLLDVLLDVGDDDDAILELAYLTLNEEQITRSLADAKRTVAAQLQRGDDVAQLLTGACVRALLRGARWVLLEQARAAER